MQDLLGRISALDPEAGAGLRVIACFDQLVVGNVDTRGLLTAAAALAGCDAGLRAGGSARSVQVTPRGELVAGDAAPPVGSSLTADGLTVWLARAGPAHAHDATILDRLALAVRIRHGRARHESDRRGDLGLLLDAAVSVEERRTAAARLGLAPGARHRVVAVPLSATWAGHPTGARDVVATPYGAVHAVVVPHGATPVAASPSGVGLAMPVLELHRSLRTAVVALRLCDPSTTPCVEADRYGGLVGVLADVPAETTLPDVDALDRVMRHAWGPGTVDAIVRAGSVRQAARLAGVHHSTLHARLGTLTAAVGFDPFDGLGRARLGVAHLAWRLRTSRVLDPPAPGEPEAVAI